MAALRAKKKKEKKDQELKLKLLQQEQPIQQQREVGDEIETNNGKQIILYDFLNTF